MWLPRAPGCVYPFFCWRYWRPNSTIPAPDGTPEGESGGACAGRLPRRTGGGETDGTLSALQIAASSLTGPRTWLLVGIAPAGTGRRGWRSRTRPRFRA